MSLNDGFFYLKEPLKVLELNIVQIALHFVNILCYKLLKERLVVFVVQGRPAGGQADISPEWFQFPMFGSKVGFFPVFFPVSVYL